MFEFIMAKFIAKDLQKAFVKAGVKNRNRDTQKFIKDIMTSKTAEEYQHKVEA